MALITKIITENGIELNYHIVSIVESSKFETRVLLHSFISKHYYNEALVKEKLIENQIEMLNKFDELCNLEEITQSQKEELNRLQQEINNLADEIDNREDYNTYVLGETTIYLPPIQDLSLKNIEQLILQTDKFKSAKIE